MRFIHTADIHLGASPDVGEQVNRNLEKTECMKFIKEKRI